MRFKKFDEITQAERAVLASECEVGLVQEDNETVLIYRTKDSSDVIMYVVNTLGEQYSFYDKYRAGGGKLMKTPVLASPEKVLEAST
jgi:hypothetical protein